MEYNLNISKYKEREQEQEQDLDLKTKIQAWQMPLFIGKNLKLLI